MGIDIVVRGSYSDKGWRICVEKLPSCSDGLELVPVAIPDCPPGGEDLPNCHDAAPGELCEGDGSCGTRGSLQWLIVILISVGSMIPYISTAKNLGFGCYASRLFAA